ncbi:uncharacterized protein MKK02DRAFT_38882 [Dioszegia hungarica]|uniref:Uncharacterized protein n=1 Tax=Dioszegia hungarica TaxID=4972 RepID=A0AA38H585_9TREE|nr:uncharacterized protein MKK02DRAFT_38882 [Dioszegia hungarica]KAI9634210.1 hypothetical protein MKK02DRAFT_38882 [Dioszegia hungarica]
MKVETAEESYGGTNYSHTFSLHSVSQVMPSRFIEDTQVIRVTGKMQHSRFNNDLDFLQQSGFVKTCGYDYPFKSRRCRPSSASTYAKLLKTRHPNDTSVIVIHTGLKGDKDKYVLEEMSAEKYETLESDVRGKGGHVGPMRYSTRGHRGPPLNPDWTLEEQKFYRSALSGRGRNDRRRISEALRVQFNEAAEARAQWLKMSVVDGKPLMTSGTNGPGDLPLGEHSADLHPHVTAASSDLFDVSQIGGFWTECGTTSFGTNMDHMSSDQLDHLLVGRGDMDLFPTDLTMNWDGLSPPEAGGLWNNWDWRGMV